MLGSVASLVASLTLIVLPVSAPCVCHSFTFFGGLRCSAAGGGNCEEQANEVEQQCCSHCGNAAQSNAGSDPVPLSSGNPCEHQGHAPNPHCPNSKHPEIHSLTLLQPAPMALIDVTRTTGNDTARFVLLVFSASFSSPVTNALRHDSARILAPPPLRFIEPVRLLI
ncbi:MAG: hypothetical protein HUU29_04130 [Planctomycetaceae bacterium]|nr:hypothetical protein [Planctomycetaceae bacterium]